MQRLKEDIDWLASEYTYKEVKEALIHGDIANLTRRNQELLALGIPEEERMRTLLSEFGATDEWKAELDIGMGDVPIISKKDDFTVPYPVVPVIPHGTENTEPFSRAGIDGKNPDPPTPDGTPVGAGAGYAGGRDIGGLDQYKTNAPENKIVTSYPYPRDDQSNRNYVDAPFTPPSQPPTIGVEGFNSEKAIPEWRYDVEDSQEDPELTELEVTRGKDGKFIKPTTKLDVMTDLSLAPEITKAREEYLQRQQDGDVEMPHVVVKAPEIPEDPHVVQEQVPRWAKYHYERPHEKDDVCLKFHMKVYDLNDNVHRPVPPSEGRGYTTTHPNCQCWWQEVAAPSKTTSATKSQVGEFTKIKQHITRKANKRELHTVKPDGTLSRRTRGTNPMREAIMEIRNDFNWLSDEYLEKVKSLPVEGQMFLIKASEEAITDHRGEGFEPFRRWLSPDELHAMARTATGRQMDINHLTKTDPNTRQIVDDWRTSSQVMDSEYNKDLGQIQMIVNEADPEILQAIADGKITAVSINGGAPRNSEIECPDEECFVVPKGVILGELDDVALTWVVTDPNGMWWKGRFIPPAKPGVKTTAIQPL